MDTRNYKIGIDAGSTTIKFVVLNGKDGFIYQSYRRHKANIRQIFEEELRHSVRTFPDAVFSIAITGSAGMGIAERANIPFIQEVIASVKLVQKQFLKVRVLLDLGGEDAKMVFFSENRHADIRMNGSCAGGTGAFIDQMASLMNISAEQLGKEAARANKIYPIASRCGLRRFRKNRHSEFDCPKCGNSRYCRIYTSCSCFANDYNSGSRLRYYRAHFVYWRSIDIYSRFARTVSTNS
jgi:activator of 2-hydroxyglutaryl-CoA dehydratase